ncbi:MAG: hypothetical protein RR642_13115 [Solibacillus sp.]
MDEMLEGGGVIKRLFKMSTMAAFSIILFGCTDNKEIDSKIEEVNYSIEASLKEKFTYLEDLNEEKRSAYDEFLESGSLTHLIDFTPEEMVLIHMNLVMNQEFDKIYKITYNGGQIDSSTTFVQEYIETVLSRFEQDFLMYRHYDSISTIDDESNADLKTVKMQITLGSSTYGITFAMLKEDGIWKMDYYHLIKSNL